MCLRCSSHPLSYCSLPGADSAVHPVFFAPAWLATCLGGLSAMCWCSFQTGGAIMRHRTLLGLMLSVILAVG
ncbi:MAG TPA: hypothetical protein VF910_02005, partial [Candidatus Bathyarchaeia archaeon]